MTPEWLPRRGVTVSDLQHAGPDPSAALEATLEEARAEYNARRYEAALAIVQKLIASLEATGHRPEGRSVRKQLLRASALVLQARLFWRLGRSGGQESFGAAVRLFKRREAEIAADPSATRRTVDFGIALARTGRFAECVRLLEPICRTGPAQPEAYAYLGYAQYELQCLEKAVETFDRGLQLAPGDKTLLSWRAETFAEASRMQPDLVELAVQAFCAAAEAAGREGDADEALGYLERARQLDPHDVQALRMTVGLHLSLGKSEESDRLLRTILADPDLHGTRILNWATALHVLVLYDLGREEDALAALDQVSVDEEELAWVLITRAEALRQFRSEEALAVLREASALAPDDVQAPILAAEIVADREPAKAVEMLQRELDRNPKSPALLEALARVALAAGDVARAHETVKRGLRIAPESARLLLVSGQVQERRGKLDLALDAYRRALRCAPQDLEVLETVVSGLSRAKRTDEALLLVERVPDSLKTHWRLHWLRGQVLSAADRLEEAADALDQAAAASQDQSLVLVNLGFVLRLLERYPEAEAAYDRALAADPSSVTALAAKANLLLDSAEYAKAADLLRSAVELEAQNLHSPEGKARLSWLHNLLGWALRRDGRTDTASEMVEYRRAIDLDPTNPWPKANLASLLLREGDSEGKTILRGLMEDQNIPNSLRGWCHYLSRQYEEALRFLRLWTNRVPNDYGVQYDLALVLLASRRSVAADEYRRVGERVEKLCTKRQRGLVYIALFDLLDASEQGLVDPVEAQPIIDDLHSRRERLGMDWHFDQLRTAERQAATVSAVASVVP